MMLEGEIAARTFSATVFGSVALTLVAYNIIRPRGFRKSEELKKLRNPIVIIVVILFATLAIYLLVNPILEHYKDIKKQEEINNKF